MGGEMAYKHSVCKAICNPFLFTFYFVLFLASACSPQDEDSKHFFSRLEGKFSTGVREISAKDVLSGEWDEVCLITGDDSGPRAVENLQTYLEQNSLKDINYPQMQYYVSFLNKGSGQIKILGQDISKDNNDEMFYYDNFVEGYVYCTKYESAKFSIHEHQIGLR